MYTHPMKEEDFKNSLSKDTGYVQSSVIFIGTFETLFYREISTAMDNAQSIADSCNDEAMRQRYYRYFDTLQSIATELNVTRP
jgi:hypothetical protein